MKPLDDEQLATKLEAAHMAGQADAGVDPSYSNAQSYALAELRPAPKFREGEVVAVEQGRSAYYFSYSPHVTYAACKRHLRLSEMPLQTERMYDFVSDLARNAESPLIQQMAAEHKAAFDREISND